ncbi:MAG: hypothetical protein HY983_00190 [Candidatus Magasanikbacteria bacterium]|nr:hypothetical protein [Candidatus Magasanikbacteria bacterium]
MSQQNSLAILETSANRKIIATVLFSFLATFLVSRLTVYLVLGHLLPNFFLEVGGVHIHHFTYGVILLALAGLYLLLKRPAATRGDFKWLTVAYGIGLGLTFDEFGMWIRLEDDYWIRQSYDAVIIVALILLNIRYYRSLIYGLTELAHLLRQILRRLRAIAKGL